MKNLLIIDGNSIINRAFYGIRLLSNKHGLFTNGIYGFLKIMFKNVDELSPDYICVAFDLKAPTFRHEMYSEYKAQRKGMPEELRMQMPVLKEVLSAMNIAILEKEGYEADDIIGTVSRMCDEEGIKCHILTGDRDDLQLASDKTDVLLTITRAGQTTTEVYDAQKVFETYGVTPTEFVDVKSLMGDSSDNVPGVKGIGEKTAFSYIQKFKSIENLYENLDDAIVKNAAREKLKNDKAMAFLSKKLCTIDRYVPMDSSICDYERKEYDLKRLKELFINLEFNAFLKDISKDEVKEEKSMCEFEVIKSESLEKLLLGKETIVYKIYNYEKSFGFAFKKDEKVYLCIDEMGKIANILKPLFESDKIMKVSSDIKSDIICLEKRGIDYAYPYFDTSIGAYIINPSKSDYSVSSVSLDILEEEVLGEKDVFEPKGEKDFSNLDANTLSRFVTGEICAIEKLRDVQKEKIKKDNQEKLLYEIELPLIKVLADMQIAGVMVDANALSSFTENLGAKINGLEEEIFNLAGEEFNINSTKQLGEILFEKLGLKIIKKTKTGYSTDASVLEKLKNAHPIIEKITEYRINTKLKSTYGDGLLAVIDPKTKRIHSNFNQTVTTTGRISSTEPNLQNIPQRREEGREIRKMFVAPEGNWVLTDADYSQIELRILAHIADDPTMIEAFLANEDIHTSTASKVFGVGKEDVTPLLRTRAKAVNFGIVYGMGDYSLSQDLHISVKEAREYIENYFEKYKNVKMYLDGVIDEAKKDGYVTTIFGRRRYIPEISSSNFMTRSFGERVAMNTPIQGSAADIIKIAMVKVHSELKKRNMKSRLILQVHDELIIETAEEEKEEVKKIMQECMTSAIDLKTKLTIEISDGKNWYDAH